MKKLYLLSSVLFLIFWGCYDPLNIYDFNYEETEPSVNLWGVDYSIENTTELKFPPTLTSIGLTGPIPPEIGNLTNLTYLDLSFCQLTGSIPPEIGNLINLTELHLGYNDLQGEIPTEIGNLSNLSQLMLDKNHLTGSIPPEIGNLSNLSQLILDENQLTGSIPSEIGNLSNLDSLKFKGNQLSGEIPENICNLIENNCNVIIYSNRLCPPYPSCIEDYVGEQDTSNCD